MAIKSFVYWAIGVVGDGTSTSVTKNLITDPFVLGGGGICSTGASAPELTFSLTLSNLPSAIAVDASSDGQIATVSLGILGNVTFTWPNPIPNGTRVALSG